MGITTAADDWFNTYGRLNSNVSKYTNNVGASSHPIDLKHVFEAQKWNTQMKHPDETHKVRYSYPPS